MPEAPDVHSRGVLLSLRPAKSEGAPGLVRAQALGVRTGVVPGSCTRTTLTRGARGHGLRSLFGPFLKDVRTLEVPEPWVESRASLRLLSWPVASL